MKNKHATNLLLVLLLTAAVPAARGQNISGTPGRWGSWGSATLQLPGGGGHRWGGFAEGQVRTNASLFRQYFYHELKGGVSYDVNSNFTVLLGGGRYLTSDYQDLEAGPLINEKRVWQQAVLSQYAKRLKLEHRYRVEQRWQGLRDGRTEFRQRLRYRLNLFLPLNTPTITTGTVFLSVYDEVFLNPRGPVFERNRLYAGVGYQLSRHWLVQAGWLRQANYTQPAFQQGVFTPPGTAAKNNLALNVVYRLTRARRADAPDEQLLPSQQE